MQHAVALSGEDDEPGLRSPETLPPIHDFSAAQASPAGTMKTALWDTWEGVKYLFYLLRPSTIYQGYKQFRQMTFKDLLKGLYACMVGFIRLLIFIVMCASR